jgi:TPR repeat protein
LNALVADDSRKEQRMTEALALVKKGPDSTVAELARGILSAELKLVVDFLEQVPRDDSQEAYIKQAIPALEPHLKELATAGVPEASYILGDMAFRAKEETEAERYFEQGAGLLHGPCMRRYGNALTNYVGSRPPDMKAAEYHLRHASGQGDMKAKVFLADMYLQQTPTESLPWRAKEAEELLAEAVKEESPPAQYLYAVMLKDFKPDDPKQPFAPELTGKKRWDRIVELLQKAVAGNETRAYLTLSVVLFTNPYGKDIAGGKEVLEKGAKLNPPDPYCMVNLSNLISGNLSNTGGLVTADEVAAAGILANPSRAKQLRMEAIKILRQAAERKKPDAIRWCELNGIPYEK